MNIAQALLPDPETLVARLMRLGLADAPIGIVTLPTIYTRTLHRENPGDDEPLLNAAVSAGRGGMGVQMTTYGHCDDAGRPLQDLMQSALAGMLRGLYREAGLDAPSAALCALQRQAPYASDREEQCWNIDGVRIELDYIREEDDLPTLSLALGRELPDSEWQGWQQPGGALAEQIVQVQDASDDVMARIAGLLIAHGHPLAAHIADMKVFLSMDNDEGGIRTIVMLDSAGVSLMCDANPGGFSIQFVHADGRLERLPPDEGGAPA